jgi:hypothetical protein
MKVSEFLRAVLLQRSAFDLLERPFVARAPAIAARAPQA